VNPYSPQPAYVQVAADLRRRITSGELGPGAALPAYRVLAGEYGVSLGTVTRAIGILRDAGLVETGTGFDTRVRQPMRRKTAVLRPGQRLATRMPTPAECESHGIDPGVPVFVLVDEQGQTTPYPGDRWEFTSP
jgi:DNA-binding GntR family transcriptional regulator